LSIDESSYADGGEALGLPLFCYVGYWMTRQEFTFTIGFQGDAAIVDKRAMRQFGRLSTMELAEKGFYRAAFCSALFSRDAEEMAEFTKHFAQKTDSAGLESDSSGSDTDQAVDRLKRLFGVYTVPDEIKRVVSL
jgi:hypothetical protein